MRGSQCTQLCFISQFMQNAEYFSFLAKSLHIDQSILHLFFTVSKGTTHKTSRVATTKHFPVWMLLENLHLMFFCSMKKTTGRHGFTVLSFFNGQVVAFCFKRSMYFIRHLRNNSAVPIPKFHDKAISYHIP